MADAFNLQLKCLSILANCEVKDLKANIDCWMSDRGSELNTLFEKLGIKESKRLKCSAHIILGIDDAINKEHRTYDSDRSSKAITANSK